LSQIFDFLIVVLTILVGISLARIPGRFQRLAQRGVSPRSDLIWRSSLTAILHFTWPLLVLYLTLYVPDWKVLVLYQPDLGIWLSAVGEVVFFKGLLEIGLGWWVFIGRQAQRV
jgi:hypothetical protein